MTSTAPEPVGTLDTALAHTANLMGSRPDLAEAQAREILAAVPGHPQAVLLLGAAVRIQGRLEESLALLEPLAVSQPKAGGIQYEIGMAKAALGRSREAAQALGRAVALNPTLIHAWRELGDQLTLVGDTAAADDAYARHIKASVQEPRLVAAAAALCDGKLAPAEKILRDFLKQHPTDVAAIRMLAETGTRLGRYGDAENLLTRCLELAPSFLPARYNLAIVLHRQNKAPETYEQVQLLMKAEPRNPGYRILYGAVLARIGEYQRAIEVYEGLLKEFPDPPKAWMSYGHALKTVGRQAESIEAYRKSLARLPSLGEAWWSLANLKTFRFSDADVAAMEAQLERSDIEAEDRFHLHFALGKAFEDAGRYEESFAHYAKGSALRREELDYDPEANTEHVKRSRALFTPEFFAARAGSGCLAPDPIFILGMPRAGSTLTEQILSSHSMVEGTMELPDIISIARRLGRRRRKTDESIYPEVLGELGPDELKALGEGFLESTRIQRKTGKPFFIDKMPNNFLHAGLIHLILPNARIIDVRRHPMGCCFSNFKQHFANGQSFTYDLTEVGRYYADYVELMGHLDAVLPGRVHRVIYERLVDDPETEVRTLLDYCGLPFEEACLRFHENARAVRTASSEQVRRPIYTEARDHWRNYEPWLGPLKTSLGPVLDAYPAAPALTP